MIGRRRRPLMRAAAVGGTAYAVGRHGQRKRQQEAQQNEQIADLQDQQQQAYAPPPAPAAAPVPVQRSETDRVAALTQLKQLLDSGVLSQSEFEVEKQKILSGG